MRTLACGLSLIALAATSAEGKPLSDGVSGALTLNSVPGLTEVTAQQNLSPRFGLEAGYTRQAYDADAYAGWSLGANFLLARYLGEASRANLMATVGLAGMRGPIHDHTAIWGQAEADWETRRVLVAVLAEAQRGNRMPSITELQIRAGYSPLEPDMKSLQPWFLLSSFSRTGSGEAQFFAILRLLSAGWWLELGTSLSTSSRYLGFSVAL